MSKQLITEFVLTLTHQGSHQHDELPSYVAQSKPTGVITEKEKKPGAFQTTDDSKIPSMNCKSNLSVSAKDLGTLSSNPVGNRLVPGIPTEGDRYTRERKMLQIEEMIFESGPEPIENTHEILHGWEEDVHPEGQLLYSKIIPSRDLKIRIHTDLPLRTKQNQSAITNAMHHLLPLLDSCHKLHTSQLKSAEIEACIVQRRPGELAYYLANHRDQTIFWLESINSDTLGVQGTERDIYRQKLAAEYWRHVTDFPHHCSLSERASEQLGPLLLLGAIDGEYCENSTAPRGSQTMGRFSTLWMQAKRDLDKDSNRAACNWICARLWYDIVSSRIVNHWGTDYARLEKGILIGDEIRPSQHQVPWFVRLLCFVFLWNEPITTMRILDDAWPGRVVYAKNWTEAIGNFANEWDRTSLLSMTSLFGSIIFTALSQVDSESTGSNLIASASAFCGFACSFISIIALIIAFTLRRSFSGKLARDVHEASSFIQTMYREKIGYLAWGMLFSLPLVLLRWAFVSLGCAICLYAIGMPQISLGWVCAELAVVVLLAIVSTTMRRLLPRSS